MRRPYSHAIDETLKVQGILDGADRIRIIGAILRRLQAEGYVIEHSGQPNQVVGKAERLDRVERRLAEPESGRKHDTEAAADLNTCTALLERRMAAVEHRVNRMDSWMNELEGMIGKVEEGVANLEQRASKLEKEDRVIKDTIVHNRHLLQKDVMNLYERMVWLRRQVAGLESA
jgi:hypothetical protein